MPVPQTTGSLEGPPWTRRGLREKDTLVGETIESGWGRREKPASVRTKRER